MPRLRPSTTALRLLVCVAGFAAALGAPATAQVRFSGEAAGATVKVLSWRDIPFRTVVRQQYDFSCGSAALATLLTYHYGRPITEADAFRAMYATGDQDKIRAIGFSMLDMKRYLAARGLQADGFRITLDEIQQGRVPVIALITLGTYRHFVVVKGVNKHHVLIGDPALGMQTFTRAEFQKVWNGVAFALHGVREGPAPQFNAVSEWTPWSRAPLRAVLAPDTLTALTSNQMPLYQISPIDVLSVSQ